MALRVAAIGWISTLCTIFDVTVTVTESATFPIRAVMMVLPLPIAVTRPWLDTVATLALLLDQETTAPGICALLLS